MTPQQRIDYEANGYLLLDINSESLSTLRQGFDRSIGHLDDLPNQDDTFIRLAEHPDIFPIVHTITSDEVQLRSLTGPI